MTPGPPIPDGWYRYAPRVLKFSTAGRSQEKRVVACCPNSERSLQGLLYNRRCRPGARDSQSKFMESAGRYPRAVDESLVGTYPALTMAGGGCVWDAVLEYRVWCHPLAGAPHLQEDDDYFCAFSTYEDALAFAERTEGAEEPLALVLQEEYIDEPAPQQFVHVRERRITEWSIDFLDTPRRTPRTIPDFLASNRPNPA